MSNISDVSKMVPNKNNSSVSRNKRYAKRNENFE